MRKNTASQYVAFQMNSATDGSAVTAGTPTVYYTIDGGAQGTGAGTATHEGNGQWSYAPTQAETNGDHVAFTMVLASAISQTVNVWPVSFDPTDAVRMGLTALPNANADAAGGLPISDAGGLNLDGLATAASIAALNDITVNQILTTQMTESYAADGVAPTLAQALFLIQQALTEFAWSGTTLTIKKLDGATTAATGTADSATVPTSLTRAT